jgi:hypothetical protein
MLQLQLDLYNYCVQVRCQDMTRADPEPLYVCNGEV